MSLSERLNGLAGEVTSADSLDELVDAVKDKEVVMLGEATHGTSEFYRWRTAITQRLVTEHDFQFVAVEGDWPASARIDRYIQYGAGGNARDVLSEINRWPIWLWANEETVELVNRLRETKTRFYGLDIYSFFESTDEIVKYLRENHPEMMKPMWALYRCLEPFARSEDMYIHVLSRSAGCFAEIMEVLNGLLEVRMMNGEDRYFDGLQNAYILKNADAYFRSMISGDESSWNIRERHMTDTLIRLLNRHQKGIVWAHNTHVGDHKGSTMHTHRLQSLGGLAREELEAENVALIGFGTYGGTVTAGEHWQGEERTLPLPPAAAESYEGIFHDYCRKKGWERFFVPLTAEAEDSPFNEVRGHRAIGVVYKSRGLYDSNYVPTRLAARYDGFVFIDQTAALNSLGRPFGSERFQRVM